jgi:L-ascorbate oxidase
MLSLCGVTSKSIPLPVVPLLGIKVKNSTHTIFEDLIYTQCNFSSFSSIAKFPRITLHCFNSMQPAPTIEMQPGRIFVTTLRNKQRPNYQDPAEGSIGTCWPPPGVDKTALPKSVTPIGYLNNPHWSRSVNIHTHGLQTSPYDDDIYIELHPGNVSVYEWTVPEDHPSGFSGHCWWHSHAMGSTHTGAANGASGQLMVRESSDLPPSPLQAKEVLLQFHSLELNRLPEDSNTLGNDPLSYSCPEDGGYSSNDFELIIGLVNGIPIGISNFGGPWEKAEEPPFVTGEAGSLLFLRFSNAAARMMLSVGFEKSGSDPLEAWLTEVDGMALDSPIVFEPGLPFAPGIDSTLGMLVSPASRLGVIVRLPKKNGDTLTLVLAPNPSPFTPEGTLPLLIMRSTGKSAKVLPQLPSSLWPPGQRRNRFIEDSEIVKTREISMQISGFPNAPPPNPSLLLPNGYYLGIDGRKPKPFEEMIMDIVPTLDTSELWKVLNPTGVAHGWHGHVFSFLIVELLDSSGRNVMTKGSSFWSDTVYIPGNHIVTFKIRFFEFPGPFVVHCHLLNHEEAGLMANVLVSTNGTRKEKVTRGMIGVGMNSYMFPEDTSHTVSSSSAFSPLCSCSCDNLLAPLPTETYMGWRYNASENSKYPWPFPRPYVYTGKLAEFFPIAIHEHSRGSHLVIPPFKNDFKNWNGTLGAADFVTLV